MRLLGWIVATGIVCATLGMSQVSLAQGGGGPGGFGRMMSNPGMLLRSEQIQKELEIVDDQLKELEAIGEEMRESFQGLRDMSPEERDEKFREINKELETRLNEVLLPHQQKRLKQITTQMGSRGRDGVAGMLTDGDLGKDLKVTEDQKKKLREVVESARTEMDEQMRKVRKDFEDKLLSVLTPEQRKQYEEMLGEPFEMDFRQMMPGRGQGSRGGRGENRQNDF
jgi:Spy/CpxP family protein refolding chaperone